MYQHYLPFQSVLQSISISSFEVRMSVPSSSSAVSKARPLLQSFFNTFDQLIRNAHAKLPSWTHAAALAFIGSLTIGMSTIAQLNE